MSVTALIFGDDEAGVESVGGGPVAVADERLLPPEPQAVDRSETARASTNPAAVCRFRAFPARRAWSISPPREFDAMPLCEMLQATAPAAASARL